MKKVSALSLLALSTGLAKATDLADVASQLPECSLECIKDAAEMFDCEVFDFECQCGKMEEITDEVSPCMVSAGCGMEEITDVAGIVADICAGQDTSVNATGAGDDDVEAEGTNEDEGNAAARLQVTNVVGAFVLAALAAVM